MKIADVARIAYEAVRAYAAGIGDNHHRKWRRLDEAHQQSLIDGVLFHYLNPRLGPEAAHLHRCKKLMEKGWNWGPVKAEEDRQSPILVPWEELPEARQMKYFIFGVIAANLAQFVEDGPVPPEQAEIAITDPLSQIVGAPLIEGEPPAPQAAAASDERQVGVGGAAGQGEPDGSHPQATPPTPSHTSSQGLEDQSSTESETMPADTEQVSGRSSTESSNGSTPQPSTSDLTEESATEEAA
jgi:hypothetical protein